MIDPLLNATHPPLRLAMWSGPRNISTAMMRAWENRPDTVVWDEPLYAHYLAHTGIPHPGADQVISHYETDWRKVVAALTGVIPDDKRIFYQKHMTHHLLPHIDRSWLDQVTHCFLIRDPAEMLTSLVKNLPNLSLNDTGLPQQVEIFRVVRDHLGIVPLVLDARDVLSNPRRMLSLLCDKLGIAFLESMLSWPAGRRDSDGIWASYWYASVEQSTGFIPYRPRQELIPESLQELVEQCQAYYQELYLLRVGQ